MKDSKNISENKWLFLLSYAPQHKAGAGISTLDFTKFITSRSIEPTIITLNRKLKEKPSETIDNVRIKRIPYFNHNILFKLLSLIWIQFCYLNYCIRNKVIWITGGKTIGLEFMLFWGWLFGKKIIFRSTLLGVDDMGTLLQGNFLQFRIRKFLFSKMHIYYSLHPEFTKRFNQYFHSKITVFQDVQGVDLARFKCVDAKEKSLLRKELSLPENKFIVITLGVLTKRKGFPDLIDFLAKTYVDIQWIIIGEKDFGKNHFLEHKAMESQEIQEKGTKILGEKVEFRGWAENPEDYLAAADIFILGGIREGIPNACLQAMACGLPSIVRNNPGFEEMLGSRKNAVLLFNSEIEFIELFENLYSNSEFYKNVSNSALNFAQINFRYEKIFDKIMTLLNSNK